MKLSKEDLMKACNVVAFRPELHRPRRKRDWQKGIADIVDSNNVGATNLDIRMIRGFLPRSHQNTFSSAVVAREVTDSRRKRLSVTIMRTRLVGRGNMMSV